MAPTIVGVVVIVRVVEPAAGSAVGLKLHVVLDGRLAQEKFTMPLNPGASARRRLEVALCPARMLAELELREGEKSGVIVTVMAADVEPV